MRASSRMNTRFVTSVTLLWFTVFTFSPLPRGEGCKEEQKRALLEIRDSTNGFAFQGWDGKNCCIVNSTYGIYCDRAGKIRGIYLDGNEWTLPSAWYPNVTLFTLFDALSGLALTNMQIGGGLQPFCELKRLKYFQIENATLDGHIPLCLGMIEKLRYLFLAKNCLHGNVPSTIFSNQSHIVKFDVSYNQLEGVLSFSIFANVSSLTYIDLSNNFNLEVETESSSWVATFQLSILNLANCNLNKRIGHSFPSFISTQVFFLVIVDLSYNSIEASIPCWLLFNTKILRLKGNKINGSFVDCIANRTSLLEALDISNNNISGPLPKNIGHLHPRLHSVDMSSNLLEGIIPWSFGNLPFLILDLSNNMFSGTIPKSLTRNGTPIKYLNLSNNKLQGEMLPKGSNMTWLQCLQLSNNQFEGIIPPMILNSQYLRILEVRNNQLSGNIPKWLYDIQGLVVVILSGNHLEGNLLQSICQMEKLQVFDISNNRISGGIPNCLHNITFWSKISPYGIYNVNNTEIVINFGMPLLIKHKVYAYKGIPLSMVTALDLSSNQFIGSIPFELGELSQLLSMNLSNNFLTGLLPNSFKHLKEMESLDLSHNKLSGKIPFELVELTSLSTFSVAYNNLSGRIPFERQFSTFDVQCYDGNPGLCGEPLTKNCSVTNGIEDRHKEQNKNKKEETRMVDNPLLFYAFIAVSYVFGFWVFFGILIINKNWRQAYFRCMDRYVESCLGMFLKYW